MGITQRKKPWGHGWKRRGAKNTLERSSGEEKAVDEDDLQWQLAQLRREQDTQKLTIRLHDDTIMTQMDTLEQQRVVINSGMIAMAMMKNGNGLVRKTSTETW